MKEFVVAFFSFKKREKRGLLVLILIVIILSLVNYYLPEFIEKEESIQFIDLPIDSDPEIEKKIADSSEELKPLMDFDPNRIAKEAWIDMGVSPGIASTIANYLKKGGRFKRTEDLLKIYNFPDSIYYQLRPFVQIPKVAVATRSYQRQPIPPKPVSSSKFVGPIYLNKSDSLDWMKFYGIGPVLSKRIVKFRDRLGGFHSFEQLKEVYGLKDSLLLSIRPNIILDTTEISKFAPEKLPFKDVLRHPYLDYEETKALFEFIKLNDGIDSLSQLEASGIFNRQKWTKIKPYLLVND